MSVVEHAQFLQVYLCSKKQTLQWNKNIFHRPQNLCFVFWSSSADTYNEAITQLKSKGLSLVKHGRSKQASVGYAWNYDHNYATDKLSKCLQKIFMFLGVWFMVTLFMHAHQRPTGKGPPMILTSLPLTIYRCFS